MYLVVKEGIFFGCCGGLVGGNKMLEGGFAGEDVSVESWSMRMI